MPLKKQLFQIPVDNLQTAIDVDDSVGRSVPVNMNFSDEGYLTKDTGFALFGAVDTLQRHSLYNYKRKDGTSHKLSVMGTKLQENIAGVWTDVAPASAQVVTITIATPAVITLAGHGFAAGTVLRFTTTGALPTGIATATDYYVIAAGLSTNTFEVSTSLGGAAVNTSGTQSGIHSVTVTTTFTNVFTAGAEMGYYVYNDTLYACNGVESYFSWDTHTFVQYTGAPKGNNLEIFEDRMFVSGVTAEPLTAYYSVVGNPTTFSATDLVKPLGTDAIVGQKNYYGSLLIFKTGSIWKLTFEYDQVVTAFIPKLVVQSRNYGACGRKAISSVENDLWFFNGYEVRSIGFQNNQIDVFGINSEVISDSIKQTLLLISSTNYAQVTTFYNNRRFYLSVPLATGVSTPDTVFVCHTLYKNSWTKYTGRNKAKINSHMVVDSVIYTTVASGSFGCIQWSTSLNDISTAISSSVLFKRVEDVDFNNFRTYRYLDLEFKNLQGVVTATVRQEANDNVASKTKAFYVGNVVEDGDSTLGEVTVGEELIGDGFGDTTAVSPFVKRRASFLSKNQAILIGVANARLNETFTISKYVLSGFEMPKKLFAPSKIISMQ